MKITALTEPTLKNVGGVMLTVYPMRTALQTEPFKDKRVKLAKPGAPYTICTHGMKLGFYDSTSPKILKEVDADGVYVIVVLPQAPNIPFVRREAENRAYKTSESPDYHRGHSSVAEGRNVIFAGELYFTQGRLTDWSRKTGHYHVGKHVKAVTPHVEAQTQFLKAADGSRLLPMSTFREGWYE